MILCASVHIEAPCLCVRRTIFPFRRNSFWAAACGLWQKKLPLHAKLSIESFLYPAPNQLQWVHYERPSTRVGDVVLPYDRGSCWADAFRSLGFQTPVCHSADQMRLRAHQMMQHTMLTLVTSEIDAAKARRISQPLCPGVSVFTSASRIGVAVQG